MANKLANQSSPYLLQHQDNPVEWYPWGEEAFATAKARGVPILVSIGYSTCHWCHVMAHESFEDPMIAQLMNDNFVNIKVDREERPDVDALYMQSVQMLGYSTGWPLNVFLTPDRLPFFGGTYWPPVTRQGMPSFTQVLVSIRDLWQRDRAKVIRGGQEVAKHLIASAETSGAPGEITNPNLQSAVRALFAKFDNTFGGFGEAPKFPQAATLEFLLRNYRRTADPASLSMVELTLGAMAEGGIYDQIGGGFSRYSVDAEWHVPHFEKMLYDNALLLPLYVDTYRYTNEPLFRDVADGIVAWLEREMLLPGGGFAAALDADSEGVEGKFYIWTAAEIDATFSSEDADLIKLHLGVADPGTFEGANGLRVVKTAEDIAELTGDSLESVAARLMDLKAQMLAMRGKRVRPSRDHKVIASWNGMAIHALAYTGLVRGNDHWIELARNAARFITRTMMAKNGALVRSWANDKGSAPGVLDDYANMIRGLISLYAATGEPEWLDKAWTLTQHVRAQFPHESGIGFYDTASDSTDLFTRPRDLTDSAIPSGNAIMAEVLMILGVLRRDDDLIKQGQNIVESMSALLGKFPMHLGMIASVGERILSGPRELILTGTDATSLKLLKQAGAVLVDPLIVRGYVIANSGIGDDWAFLVDKPATPHATAFWCRDYICLAPEADPENLTTTMLGQ